MIEKLNQPLPDELMATFREYVVSLKQHFESSPTRLVPAVATVKRGNKYRGNLYIDAPDHWHEYLIKVDGPELDFVSFGETLRRAVIVGITRHVSGIEDMTQAADFAAANHVAIMAVADNVVADLLHDDEWSDFLDE